MLLFRLLFSMLLLNIFSLISAQTNQAPAVQPNKSWKDAFADVVQNTTQKAKNTLGVVHNATVEAKKAIGQSFETAKEKAADMVQVVSDALPSKDHVKKTATNVLVSALNNMPSGIPSMVDIPTAIINAGWKEGLGIAKAVIVRLIKERIATYLGFGGIYSKDVSEKIHGYLTLSSGVIVSIVVLKALMAAIPMPALLAYAAFGYVGVTYMGLMSAKVLRPFTRFFSR